MKNNLAKPQVAYIVEGNNVKYMPYVHDYSQDYLTFVATESGTISFNIRKRMGTDMITSISYSTDNGSTWTTTNNVNNKQENLQISVNVNANDKVLWKGIAQQLGFYDEDYEESVGSFFSSTCEFNAEGNVMSMLYGDNFIGEDTIERDYALYHLFSSCNIVDASNMVLPATTLAERCYYRMFADCTSLTTAPSLLATTLTDYCYASMFYGCTSLTTAPELPATTLAYECYSNMFQECTSLNSITCLATDISADYCTSDWVDGVAASGTFTKAASMTSWTSGTDGIPSGWTTRNAT